MRRYLNYFLFILKHKWYVFIECFKEGIIWRGIIHDMSKFLPSEFFPYAKNFYNKDGTKKEKKRDKSGYYKPTDTGNKDFDFAFVLHQKRNRHHWQWWIIPDDNQKVKILDIPIKYVKEMVCDWRGASKTHGTSTGTVKNWYQKNENKITLHKNVKIMIKCHLLKISLDSNYLAEDMEYFKNQITKATRIPKGYLK